MARDGQIDMRKRRVLKASVFGGGAYDDPISKEMLETSLRVLEREGLFSKWKGCHDGVTSVFRVLRQAAGKASRR